MLAYDAAFFDSVRHTLLPSERCPAPCFMGIQINITEPTIAKQRLDSNPWIASSSFETQQTSSEYVVESRLDWEWTYTQPAFLPWQGYVRFNSQEQAEIIEVPTAITYGEILVAFGFPERAHIGNVHHYAWYPEYGLYVRTLRNCDNITAEYVTIFYMDWKPPPDSYSYQFIKEQSC